MLYKCEKVLEREGVYGNATLMDFPLGFLPIDKDLFSLEISDFYRAFYLKSDLAYIHTAAMSLVQLCKICGSITKISGQGKCAKMVVDMMNLMMKELKYESPISDSVSHLIVLDRDIDYISVLLSQLTYEGLLDETFGINNGRVIFPQEVSGKDEPVKVVLNSSDLVFEEIRNSYFTGVFGFLRDKAKQLQAQREITNMSLSDIKQFVTKEMKSICQQQTSLSLHIRACEVILEEKNAEDFHERLNIERDIIENQNVNECMNYIEDIINKQDSFKSALRLICLLSIAQNGLPSSDYSSVMTQFRQSYGCKYIVTFHNLEKTGLVVEQASLLPPGKIPEKGATAKATKIVEKVATAVSFPRYSNFKTVVRKFNLIPAESDSSNVKNPKDMSYVFGGAYVPLIGRITEQIIKYGSFHNLEDGLKLLPGSTIMNFKKESMKQEKDLSSKTVIVYVLGGITYAEVAALRLLGQLNSCRIYIATTSFINGNSLMEMLSP
ncbi:Vacuolar protein sorting-associated protein 33B, partial [Stegodyphus mimosarum]